MLASIFHFLFKYELLVFERGRFVFGATRSMWVAAVVAGVGALYVVWTYRQLSAVRGRQRAVLLALRIGLFLIGLGWRCRFFGNRSGVVQVHGGGRVPERGRGGALRRR